MREELLSRKPNSSYSGVLLYLLLFSFISFALIYSFAIDKYLSADGAHYFATILDRRNFTYIAWSRQFANYLTQWSVVLAVKLGVKHIPLLSNFYGVGLYFPYFASFLICIYAVRKEQIFLLVFPLISILGINLPSDYILVGEHQVMVLLSWSILLLLLRKQPLNWLDGGILWLLLFLFSRTYETAIVPAILFAAIAIMRLCKVRQNRKQCAIYGVSLLLSCLAFSIALYSIINPRDAANKAGFILAIWKTLGNETALVTASFAFLSTIGLIYRKNVLILASLFPIVFYAYRVFSNNYSPTAVESFSSRTLTLFLLPFLLICAIVSSHCNLKSNKISTRILILLVLTVVLGNLHLSNAWKQFHQQLVDIITTRDGYISVEQTTIKDSPYRWGWTNPELGILWSYPCVKSILLNSPDVKWEPFNPREKLILKKYVSYDAFFSRVDDDIKICK